MYTPVSKILAFGLLVAGPLASALAIPAQVQDLTLRSDTLETRHHTAAQIAVRAPDIQEAAWLYHIDSFTGQKGRKSRTQR
jgi:hypothetical protein